MENLRYRTGWKGRWLTAACARSPPRSCLTVPCATRSETPPGQWVQGAVRLYLKLSE